MVTDNFKITVHMVTSLDGFIAKKDNSVSWFETSSEYEKGIDSEDPIEFLKTIDCYVMGSRTYELALELSKEYGWAYGDKPVFVLTTRNLTSEKSIIEFHSGDLPYFVEEKLKPKFKQIWVVGGSQLVGEFIRLKLADEIRVSILPIILGDGLKFFEHVSQEQKLKLTDSKTYKNGMVEICYRLEK